MYSYLHTCLASGACIKEECSSRTVLVTCHSPLAHPPLGCRLSTLFDSRSFGGKESTANLKGASIDVFVFLAPCSRQHPRSCRIGLQTMCASCKAPFFSPHQCSRARRHAFHASHATHASHGGQEHRHIATRQGQMGGREGGWVGERGRGRPFGIAPPLREMLETGGLEETHSCLHPALAVAREPTCQVDAALTPGLSQDSFADLGQSPQSSGHWAAGGDLAGESHGTQGKHRFGGQARLSRRPPATRGPTCVKHTGGGGRVRTSFPTR